MQDAREKVFQQDIIDHLVSNGWMLGQSDGYDRKHALYPEDLVGYLSETRLLFVKYNRPFIFSACSLTLNAVKN